MNMLSTIKRSINTGKPCNVDKILSKIEKYDVISFDIFDTLLKRNVQNPTDVFKYMESQLMISEFATKRIVAEKKAREKANKNEITLKDIYDNMNVNYAEEELKAESDLLIVNDEMIQVFNECVKYKDVVLTSDMYLPENFVVDILKREGIVGYKKIFLSSTVNKTKRSGELFEYVIENLDIDTKKIVHIGDSYKADYLMPKKMGIRAIHIPTHTPKSQFHIAQKGINENIINTFLDNTSPIDSSNYYRFGYEKFGMFLWGYSKWLYDSIKKADISDIYFFSRDGLIMKQAFDTLYNDVNTHYLEVSRRSLRVPILWMNYKLEYVINMISPSKNISLAMIFDGVGLDINNYTFLIKKYGFDLGTTFDRKDILQDQNLNDLYNEIAEDIEGVSKNEYKLLTKYIKQNNLAGKYAIVDIGWSGGMQRYLIEVLQKLGIDAKIKGFYIGVADYYKRNKEVIPTIDLNGYLFDFSHNINEIDKRSAFVGLFETLFLEQDGSVKNYKYEDGLVKANRLQYEYLDEGKPTYEYKCIKEIQKGAIDFIRRFGKKDINVCSDILYEGLKKTGLKPNVTDIKMFSDFRFLDEGEIEYLAKPKNLFYYLLNIKALKKDFLSSRWKIGFMKRLFKIDLPYVKIYQAMLKYK